MKALLSTPENFSRSKGSEYLSGALTDFLILTRKIRFDNHSRNLETKRKNLFCHISTCYFGEICQGANLFVGKDFLSGAVANRLVKTTIGQEIDA
jgi:hypothetical protein